MSFEENLPANMDKLNKKAAAKRQEMRDLEDTALSDIRQQISDKEDEMSQLEDEYEDIKAELQETPEYQSLVKELAQIEKDYQRLKTYQAAK